MWAWIARILAGKAAIVILWGLVAAGGAAAAVSIIGAYADRARLAERADRLKDNIEAQNKDLAYLRMVAEEQRKRMAAYEEQVQAIERERDEDRRRLAALRSTLAKESADDPATATRRIRDEFGRVLTRRVTPGR